MDYYPLNVVDATDDGYYQSHHCTYRLVSRDIHKLNVRRLKRSTFYFQTWYHSLLEYSWWKLVVLLIFAFLLINLTFGLFYLWDVQGLNGVPDGYNPLGLFYICFCFSVQTLTTIGYGALAPASLYIHTIAVIEGFLSFVASALLTGLVFAKISRPTKLSRQIIFSDVAVVNRETPAYLYDSQSMKGEYGSQQYPVISIRMSNTRKSQLCNTQVRLLLLRRELAGKPTAPTDTRARTNLCIHELDFEIYNQVGRNRGIGFSIPYLALPWTINHTVNEESPLYGIPPSEWQLIENHFELIVILDAVDEGVSMNVQARWSYLPHEIILDASFVEITRLNPKDSVYEIDYSKFNDVTHVPSPLYSNT